MVYFSRRFYLAQIINIISITSFDKINRRKNYRIIDKAKYMS